MLSNRSTLPHDRRFVRRLHQAYADKTESFFTGLARASGDPCKVKVRTFGSARTLIACGHDWLNRATLVGDETVEQLEEIIAHFDQQGARCHIEWNPGNCYRGETWDDALGRWLIDRGFRPGGFRCVWATELPQTFPEESSPVTVRAFGPSDMAAYLEALGILEGSSASRVAERQLNVAHGERDDHWHHYVAYLDGIPCANATLFTGADTAYLEWGQTREAYRGRGCHRALIRRRLIDAAAAGCSAVFAVTDVGVQSARNLRSEGFALAYNYVMLTRDPASVR